MISVANTAVGLTHYAPWNDPGEPGIYYPTGKRNYARVAASDDYQGPAAADLLKKLDDRSKSVYILHDNQTFGKGVANGFRRGPRSSGIKVLGFEPWDAKATSYEAIGQRIKATGAQSVYLGGIVCNNGVKLIKDIRAARRPEAGVRRARRLDAVLRHRWPPGRPPQGMYVSYAGLPLEQLGREGQGVHRRLRQVPELKKGELPPPYAVYQAQAAQIMLDAIAKSNGTRSSVTTKLFKTQASRTGSWARSTSTRTATSSRPRRSASTS